MFGIRYNYFCYGDDAFLYHEGFETREAAQDAITNPISVYFRVSEANPTVIEITDEIREKFRLDDRWPGNRDILFGPAVMPKKTTEVEVPC